MKMRRRDGVGEGEAALVSNYEVGLCSCGDVIA